MKHYNPSITERLFRIFQPKAGDQFSDEVSGPYAVIPVTPVTRVVAAVAATVTGSTTIFTTPARKDFYLTGIQMSWAADAACDAVQLNAFCTIDTLSVNIMQLMKTSGVQYQLSDTVIFPFPIKVDRNTNIRFNTTFAAGSSRHGACIYGYTEEVTAS